MLLLLGWAGWKVVAIMSARPGPMVDYTRQLIALSEKYQPEGENGWPALVAALEHFDNIGVPDVEGWPTRDEEIVPITYLDAVRVGSFDRERIKYELAYLEHITRSGVLEELDTALSAPRFVRTRFPGAEECLMWMDAPELGSSRRLSMARTASLRVAAENGDWPALARAWADSVRLAAALSYDPILLSHLVAQANLTRASEELNRLLVEHRLDESICWALLATSGDHNAIQPIGLSLEGERLVMYDLIQRTHSDDGHGDGLLIVDALETFAENNHWSNRFGSVEHPVFHLVGVVYPRRAETRQLLDEFMDGTIRQSRVTREQASDATSIKGFRDRLPERQVFLKWLLPSVASALDRWSETRSKIAATHVLLGLEIYEARHGEPPRSLDDLVPECLPVVPLDAASGQNFVYVRRDATSDDPRRFLLYSVGVDGVDNGGIEPSGSSGVNQYALRDFPQGRGFDYIFNRLREPVEEEQ